LGPSSLHQWRDCCLQDHPGPGPPSNTATNDQGHCGRREVVDRRPTAALPAV